MLNRRKIWRYAKWPMLAAGTAAGLYVAYKFLDPAILHHSLNYASVEVRNVPGTLTSAMGFDNSSPWGAVTDLDRSNIDGTMYFEDAKSVMHLQADFSSGRRVVDVNGLEKGMNYIFDVRSGTVTPAGSTTETLNIAIRRLEAYGLFATAGFLSALGFHRAGERLITRKKYRFAKARTQE